MAPPIQAAPGQTLDGRFFLLEEIGRGGMARVFKARDLENQGALVAVKVPLPEYASGVGSWSLSQREAEIGLRLAHPYVLRFIANSAGRHRNLVVTEYVAGETLASRVGQGRSLPEREALRIGSCLAEAVAYLHGQGIVHYDLKPANVILCPDGSPRLIDFGVAHALASRAFAATGPAPPIVTADYAAPEQIARRRGQASVDIYALGAILYEMLTGHPPFEGDDPFVVASARQIGDPVAPRSLNPAISAEVEEIVLRALRRDPAQRHPSALALKAALDHPERIAVTGLARRLVPVTPRHQGLRWMRYLTLVGAAPLAFLVVSFRLLWWYLEAKAGQAGHGGRFR